MKFEAANDNHPTSSQEKSSHGDTSPEDREQMLVTSNDLDAVIEVFLQGYTEYAFQEESPEELKAEYEKRVKNWTLSELYDHLMNNKDKPLNALTFAVIEEAANRFEKPLAGESSPE